jgi:hypothetical protein
MSASRRVLLAAFAAAITAGLGGCYVVPIDPRTGQAYPLSNVNASNPPGGGVTVINPAPAAPAQPSVLSVRLYPVNAQASKGGLLSAVVIDNNAGHGSFTVPYLGDTLQGESTRVDSGFAAFGRIHDEVLGRSPRSFSGRRGIANAVGTRGVSAQCEYLITGPGAGTGVCAFSDGANYQMHFGG